MAGRRLLLVALAVLCCSVIARADGDPTTWVSDAGMLAPMARTYVHVLDQRIKVTIPESRQGMVRIRVEYMLKDEGYGSDGKSPYRLPVSWLVNCSHYRAGKGPLPASIPVVSLDGHRLKTRYVPSTELVAQYAHSFRKRIDSLLRSRPTLKARVEAIRVERKGVESVGVHELALWMAQHGLFRNAPEAESVARGLLWASECEADHSAQVALKWLDPAYQTINVAETLAERWGRDTFLLDPHADRLVNVLSGSGDHDMMYGLFRFDLVLKPKMTHRLVVEYSQKQGVGGGWYGIAYIMTPARHWGRWDRTQIDIEVPWAWRRVAIRPGAVRITSTKRYRLYRIKMLDRPWENLYVSYAAK